MRQCYFRRIGRPTVPAESEAPEICVLEVNSALRLSQKVGLLFNRVYIQSLCLSWTCERVNKANGRHSTSVHSGYNILSRKHKDKQQAEANNKAKVLDLWIHDQQQNLQSLSFAGGTP